MTRARVESSEAPLIGRQGVLDVLHRAYAAAAGGATSTVIVRGDSGIGKSRLIREFVEHVGDQCLLLGGSCIDVTDQVAYAAVASVLRSAVRALGEDRVRSLLPRDARALLARFGDSSIEASNSFRDPRGVLFDAVVRALDRLADIQPVVLVIEDAQWIDADSWNLLTYLMHEFERRPVLVVVSHRALPFGHALRRPLLELTRLRNVTEIELPPLLPAMVADMAAALLGRRSDESTVAGIVERSGGNPFFVELLTGDISAGDRRIREHLVAPLEQLPEQTLQVLRTVAVAAPHVGHDLLASVTGLAEPALGAALTHAIDAGVLRVADDGYEWLNPLLGQAVRDDVVLPGERSRLHRILAAAIDADPSLAPPERHVAPGEAGRHWEAGGHPAKALTAYLRAAQEAGKLDLHAERMRMLDNVLRLWDRVPDADERVGMSRAAVMVHAVDAANLSCEFERGMKWTDAALASALINGEPDVAAAALARRACLRSRLGSLGATEDLAEAIELTEGNPGTTLRARLLAHFAERQRVTGRSRELVEDLATRALGMGEESGDSAAAAHARLTLASLSALDGDLDKTRLLFAEARSGIAALPGSALLIVRSYLDEAELLHTYGEFASAAETARTAMRHAAHRGQERSSGAVAAARLAESLTALGSWDEAWDVIENALATKPPSAHRAELSRLRARLLMWRGDAEAAAAEVAAVHRLIGPRFDIPADQFAHAELEIDLALRRDDPEAAWRAVEHAFEVHSASRCWPRAWPIVALGARALGRTGVVDVDSPRLGRLRTIAGDLPCRSPRDEAWRLCFHAELAAGHAELASGPARWGVRRDEVNAWREAGDLVRLAEALFAASAETPQGAEADGLRREAWDLVVRLGADGLAPSARNAGGRDADGSAVAAGPQIRHGDATARSWMLTDRERDVLDELAMGKTNREIAASLFITPKTVGAHVSSILLKMGAANRSEATAKAFRHGVAPVDSGT